ncbi:hypothetical protein U9M48_000796 [Paspalum notatum var. saurae]|uniref:DDE Tnp4 domain-containing protein n=1 Tax=Paspalum notatum var. saurae TaxID=547442 RepID=A0AAQ3PM54_PASNO
MLAFAHTVIAPKDPTYAGVHHSLGQYAPYFDGCIGAIDGTHIRTNFAKKDRQNYMSRKGFTSYNVLATVDMDMRFTYVATGMAGSCHDMMVLRQCMKDPMFPEPPLGKYYLADAGYVTQKGYLGRYIHGTSEPKETLFNSCHASLRVVVERAFGLLKKKWQIMKEMSFFAKDMQGKFIIACFALHNFLLDCRVANGADSNNSGAMDHAPSTIVDAMKDMDLQIVRDWIANGLHDDYGDGPVS